MSEFDPDRSARVHDRLNDESFDWPVQKADRYRKFAQLDKDGAVHFDGLILDGWEPMTDQPPTNKRRRSRPRKKRVTPFSPN